MKRRALRRAAADVQRAMAVPDYVEQLAHARGLGWIGCNCGWLAVGEQAWAEARYARHECSTP